MRDDSPSNRYKIPTKNKKLMSKAVASSKNWLIASKDTSLQQMTRSLFDSSTHKQISDIVSLESGSALKHMATMATDPITKLPY